MFKDIILKTATQVVGEQSQGPSDKCSNVAVRKTALRV